MSLNRSFQAPYSQIEGVGFALNVTDTSTSSGPLDVAQNNFITYGQIEFAGNVTAVVTRLEMSNDGTNWVSTGVTVTETGYSGGVRITTKFVRVVVQTAGTSGFGFLGAQLVGK